MSNLARFIGLRYTRAKSSHQFLSFVSGFSFLGMMLGVMALVVVLSVMNGFDRELKQRLLAVIPHGFISTTPYTEDWEGLAASAKEYPQVVGAAPYIEGFALLSNGGLNMDSALIAIDPGREREVSIIDQHIIAGDMAALKPGEYGIVIGRILAQRLRVRVGDKITLTLPEVSITPAGAFPRSKRFTVVAVFKVGAQVDQSLAMIHLRDGQKLFKLADKVHGVRVAFEDIYQAETGLNEIQQSLDVETDVKSWAETQGSLFQAMKMEKIMIAIMLFLIVAVAAFNVITSLVLMVADKRADIAVLRTMGMSERQVMRVFVTQGMALGGMGIVLGLLLGLPLAYWIGDLSQWLESLSGQQLFDPDIYFIAELPSELRLKDILVVSGIAFLITLLATLYPAYRASRIEPAEALRYE
ncbi:lipoprotein-releasing ABC transporter permease subunit [Pseudoteredinibacter isoporae]|uniref:Lipoprotein-releasing system permease protein n=1 Tax=Pseudoteredinibacter isoporae TaxID=570281 RepID=A0A7X0JUJ3_9GAMM|nr:lipoprotein-releasing ABC transporter permease subunit [Pseudoteredinibacter isoporae]MBB6521695.1 lipoprotein-releasing system permease protein [Pseudoteredinibacter isoporae]NHO87243.1 lipoprotein-releasing ABC transporter permease subunit [Pseudoteredinibacter isoporae]NIB23125.1 lipoprotein-releasing ABC transporter permease subunit [Pseudoteredinibacter isoporae]